MHSEDTTAGMTDSNGDLVAKVARVMFPQYESDSALLQTAGNDIARQAIAAVLDDLQNSAMNSTFAFDLIDEKRRELGL